MVTKSSELRIVKEEIKKIIRKENRDAPRLAAESIIYMLHSPFRRFHLLSLSLWQKGKAGESEPTILLYRAFNAFILHTGDACFTNRPENDSIYCRTIS